MRSLSDGYHQSGKLLREGVHEGDEEEKDRDGRRRGEGECFSCASIVTLHLFLASHWVGWSFGQAKGPALGACS